MDLSLLADRTRPAAHAPKSTAATPSPPSEDRPVAPALPHEILCAIVHLGVPPFGPTPLVMRRRKRALRRYALVNSQWHAAALDEAVSAVYINTHANGWSQDVATATRRVREAKEHAERYGRGVRTLDIFGEKHIPAASVQFMFAEFDKLENMTLMKMRRPHLLIGSKPLRRLHILHVRTPTFTGVYTNLTRLEMIDCCGELLPSCLTDANFPALETLVLQLAKARQGFPVESRYGARNGKRPPDVRVLALRGAQYAFMQSLIAGLPRLNHLHLATPLDSMSLFIRSLAHPLTSLTIEPDPGPHSLFSNSPPLDGLTAAHSIEITFLARLELSVVHAPSLESDFWLSTFEDVLSTGAAERGLNLDCVRTDKPFEPLQWDPVHDPSCQPSSLTGLSI
ncbi:hypothetical protein JCM3770_007424 [Rhodotorula araucariae]